MITAALLTSTTASAESCSTCISSCARDFKKICLYPERCRTALASCEGQCRLEACRQTNEWRALIGGDDSASTRRQRRSSSASSTTPGE
jgi:hypothetical protein